MITISGGSFGSGFGGASNSDVELIGGEFKLNGAPFSGTTITLNDLDVFTGTLADGSAFIFGRIGFLPMSDTLGNVQLTSVALPPLDLSQMVVSTSNPNLPSGLRSGQTLTLQDGGQLGDNFEAVDAVSYTHLTLPTKA